jgi:hypothetical protein
VPPSDQKCIWNIGAAIGYILEPIEDFNAQPWGGCTTYIVTQLSKDIKSVLLPQKYHVVLDEAYPCL